jgi:hypothetical protein
VARFGSQKAPRGGTILVSAVLVLVGIVGTFLGWIPAIGSVDGETLGILAYVVAAALMLIGIFTRGL